ncbi:MAG: glycogen debranching protein [Isosphaerales bacterium]
MNRNNDSEPPVSLVSVAGSDGITSNTPNACPRRSDLSDGSASAPSEAIKPRGPTAVATYRFRGHALTITPGYTHPPGASATPGGVNFVLISRHGTAVSLILLEPFSGEVDAEIPFDPQINRTGDNWHVRVEGLPEEFCYGYRVDGPKGGGHHFDFASVLLDPASRALSCGRPWAGQNSLPRRSLVNRSMSLVADDISPRIPREDTILYELHIRGFTVDPSSGVRHPGTFAGLIEKIAYLKELGITTVELLPIGEFDELDCPLVNPISGERLRNFWGYNTIAFAAPKAAYASNPERCAPWEEFRRMVRAFHDAGIEVIVDAVFNHTAEGGEGGTTYSFRGIDNCLYYLLDDQGHYLNFTGCGNTLNSNHPVVRNYLLNCLHDWVAEAGVDGFRFDLASLLGRDQRGQIMVEPPVVERISEDSLLAGTKLIAEPWDVEAHRLGRFPSGARWLAWNSRYRDDVRRFWRGDAGMISSLATRLCGSEDLFPGVGPLYSLNFVTCHDGFTLCDLVSYDYKHNEANGEGNRYGVDDNFSWNCGVEGPTDDPEIVALRRRQARNLIATLLISQGVPMLPGGDEFLRTQAGNNNAWCQDNKTSWVEWTLAEENADFLLFVRRMIALRKRHPALRRRTFFQGSAGGHPPDIVWHGVEPCRPDFSPESHSLAFALDGRRVDGHKTVDRDLYIAMSAWKEPLSFTIPGSPSGRRWRRAVDTALSSPEDALGSDEGPVIPVLHAYRVEPHSLIVLVSEA